MLDVFKKLIRWRSKLEFSLVPSLPASSFGELKFVMDTLTGVSPEFQVDLVDGKFVPLISWPYVGVDPMAELVKLKKFSDKFSLELDCMIVKPEKQLDSFFELNIKRLIIHYGSTSTYQTIIKQAHDHGIKVGLAFTNDSDKSEITNLIPQFDFIQIMGIEKVGQQGQPFDVRTLASIRYFRSSFPSLEIAIDGAVNEKTIPDLLNAGANRLAPGSAIAKATNPKSAYLTLRQLLP